MGKISAQELNSYSFKPVYLGEPPQATKQATPRKIQQPVQQTPVNIVHPKQEFRYEEVYNDLFNLSEDYMLVHCVSSDFKLGAGIAKVFNDRFNMSDKLEHVLPFDAWDGTGYCGIVNMDRLFTLVPKELGIYRVANLVTKEHYYDKPTLYTMQTALQDLRLQLHMTYPEVKKLGMPLIGCGLDKLNWSDVSNLIKQVFYDTELTITVCRL